MIYNRYPCANFASNWWPRIGGYLLPFRSILLHPARQYCWRGSLWLVPKEGWDAIREPGRAGALFRIVSPLAPEICCRPASASPERLIVANVTRD